MRLVSVTRASNQLTATLINELTRAQTELTVDQVIVDMGTVPDGDLFATLWEKPANAGVADIPALLANAPQPRVAAGFELHRIGDARASRNILTAIYDAFRLRHIA